MHILSKISQIMGIREGFNLSLQGEKCCTEIHADKYLDGNTRVKHFIQFIMENYQYC